MMEIKINNKIISINKDTGEIFVSDNNNFQENRSLRFIDMIDLFYFCSKVMNNSEIKKELYSLNNSEQIVKKEDIKELQKTSAELVDTVKNIDILIAQISEVYEWLTED